MNYCLWLGIACGCLWLLIRLWLFADCIGMLGLGCWSCLLCLLHVTGVIDLVIYLVIWFVFSACDYLFGWFLVFWLNCLGVCLLFECGIVVYLCLFYCYSCLSECVLSFVWFTLYFFTYLVWYVERCFYLVVCLWLLDLLYAGVWLVVMLFGGFGVIGNSVALIIISLLVWLLVVLIWCLRVLVWFDWLYCLVRWCLFNV